MARILVAEDSLALSNLLQFVLTQAGHEPTICRQGDKALEAAKKNQFDLLIFDQQMPRMTGLEVAEAVRKDSLNSSTPICLCTAKWHELDIETIKSELSISEILRKPFSPRDMVSLADRVIKEHSVTTG